MCVLQVSLAEEQTNASPACADGSAPVVCKVHPCSNWVCAPDEACEADFCHGCHAVCKPRTRRGGIPGRQASPSPNSCPDGGQPVNCLMDPCMAKPCTANETCTSNYCGGCNAVCKPKTSAITPDDLTPPLARTNGSQQCPDGSRPFSCLIDPCRHASCAADEVCFSNYCGGCQAVCIKSKTNRTTGQPANASVSNHDSTEVRCPGGLRLTKCLVDPCRIALCAAEETCESSYCGGCHAICKMG